MSRVMLIWICLPAMAMMLLPGCTDRPPRERPSGPTRIVVSIPPIAWAVQQLAPEGAEVRVLLQQGQSEHGASLTASDATALRRADFVFFVGWGLESSAERVVREPADWQQIVRLSRIVEASDLDIPHSAHECDDPSHQHIHHYATDPHAWLDPHAMALWVRAVGEALGADPERIELLVTQCLDIDREYTETLASVPSRHIVTHHNAYGWIAQRYGLEVAAVIRPNELLETTPGELNAAVVAVRELGIGAAFIEPQFSDRAANRLREITGVRLLTLDPLGHGDWPATMRANLASLAEGLALSASGGLPVPSEG